MTPRTSPRRTLHAPGDITRALSLFFTVRRVMRTRFAQGKKFDPSAWLQMETMRFIMDHDKPKMKDVADYLSIAAPSATSLIQGLVKSGLVALTTDRRDRRASRVALTKKGKSELKKSVIRGTKILGRLFAALSEEELTIFIDLLGRLKAAEKD